MTKSELKNLAKNYSRNLISLESKIHDSHRVLTVLKNGLSEDLNSYRVSEVPRFLFDVEDNLSDAEKNLSKALKDLIDALEPLLKQI